MGKNDPQVLVAGGGIGGLASALLLARAGLCSRVLEQRSESSADGAGIQIGPNGTRVLRELGVLEALAPFAGEPSAIVVVDGGTGETITEFPLGDWMAERFGNPYWVLHRVDLHRVLFDAARESARITIDMDAAVVDVDASSFEQVSVRTRQGQSHSGQVLVGADGIWSRVREHVLGGTVAPRFLGMSAARVVIPMSRVPPSIRRDAVTLWMRPNAHFVHYPIRGGQELAVVAVCRDGSAREAWGSDVETNWVVSRMAGFSGRAIELVEAGEGWRVWGLHTFARLPRWVRGRVALVGDAAHPILPYLAQGGVMALEDAKVLADVLSEAGGRSGGMSARDVGAALDAYCSRRRSRVFRVQRRSVRQGQIYHMSGVLAGARNLALRHGSPRRFMAGFDWLYGWRSQG